MFERPRIGVRLALDRGDPGRSLGERLFGEALDPFADGEPVASASAGLERDAEVPRGREAVVGIALQPSQHDRVEAAGTRRASELGRRHVALEHACAMTSASLSPSKSRSPVERLPEHDRRGVDVRLRRSTGCRSDLLGRHVRELALELPLARRLRAAGGLRDAEVEHARDAVGARRGRSAGDTSRCTMPSGSPALVLRLVRGVQAVEHVAP